MDGSLPIPGYNPARKFDDPRQLSAILTRHILPLVNRPARYIGGELGAPQPDWQPDLAKILLAFPDTYEIGMSYLGLRILYSQLLRHRQVTVDLVFAPWIDMEMQMRRAGLPLFGLQTRRPASQFDVIGFSLCYELTYTNLLTMVDLAGMPLLAADRREGDPIVIAGGSCTLNPQVMAPYVDVLFLGDGEETIVDVVDAVNACRHEGGGRAALCAALTALPGAWRFGSGQVDSRILPDLNRYPPPVDLVPVIEPVHDRLSLEVMRGCARGCRFCQAGMINRPVRERDVAPLVEAAVTGVGQCGWHELSLLSLSTTDYSGLEAVVAGLRERITGSHTNLVVPSLRVDSVSPDLHEWISQEAPASFTFAPEAGSQRLRDVINKQITEDDVLQATHWAFGAGAKKLKLYFMIGLPTETQADLAALVALVGRVVDLAPRGGSQVTVSISPFAPKPHTPFQWAGQIPAGEIARRNRYLEQSLRRLRVKVDLRDPEVSAMEALLGLGDEKVGRVVLQAWRLGARFDGWTESFDHGIWQQAFASVGVEPATYLAPRDPQAALPWDGVTAAVDKDFLRADWERALAAETLSDCRLAGECYDCAACSGTVDHVFAVTGAGEGETTARERGTPPVTGGDVGAEAEELFDPRNARRDDPAREERCWSVWRRQAATKCWYRAEYAKEGDQCYLGHLDFQRQLHLALRRSGLPIAYSQGYHPHPLLKFGPPLPVGVGGERETFDIALVSELPGWEERLNANLPAGVRILRSLPMGALVPLAIDKHTTRLEYVVELPPPATGGPSAEEVRRLVARFLASERWPYLRQRPKGSVEVDARALVDEDALQVLEHEAGADNHKDGTILKVVFLRSTGEANLPIHDFLAALCGPLLPEPRWCRIRRTGMYGRSPSGPWRTPLEDIGERLRRLWFHKKFQN